MLMMICWIKFDMLFMLSLLCNMLIMNVLMVVFEIVLILFISDVLLIMVLVIVLSLYIMFLFGCVVMRCDINMYFVIFVSRFDSIYVNSFMFCMFMLDRCVVLVFELIV